MSRFMIMYIAVQLFVCTSLSAQKLYIPPELSRAARVPVKGRPHWKPGKPVQFAEYSAVRAESHWPDPPTGPGSETLAFRVTVKGRGVWRGDCAPVTVMKKDTPPEASDLRCRVTPEGGDTSQVWRLEMHTTKGKMPKGELWRGRARLEVVGTNNLDNRDVTPGDRPAGFHVLLQGQGVAAIELFDDGVVMFDTGLPTERRDAVAVVAAGMFLWDDLVYPRR